jgi:hypothetical protein
MMKKDEIFLAGALRRLFKNRFILRSRSLQWFQVIVDNQIQIRMFLEKMGATIELNETLGFVFIKPTSQENEDLIDFQLGTGKNLSRYASILLIFLRQKRLAFYSGPGNEERPLVKHEEIREFLNEFNFHKEDKIFQREYSKAVGELIELQILLKLGDDEIFEISPVCDVVLPADQVSELKARVTAFVHHQKSEDAIEMLQGEEGDHVR